jgi:Asp-tRNA(Asn)/Glu-tRNA(Gln) amidotransferase A subunit family amidase
MQLPSGTTVAAKLREAGVILLGESKLSQWANFRSCRPVIPFGGELMVG